MCKVLTVQLDWKYTPKNYIEEPISISFQGGNLDIKEGVAVAKIDPAIFHSNSSIEIELTQKIENRLLAIEILTHKNFNLSKPSRIDLYEDGKRNIFAELESLDVTMRIETVDIIVKDKEGNVKSDTKRERLNKEKKFASLVNRFRNSDSTLDQMLKSYQNSVKDPNNEFIHLYEIRESLLVRFLLKKNAIKKLGLTNNEWDEIGKLANNPLIKQGRHRGKAPGSLRNAEIAELEKARKSVAYLIEKYLEYLEAGGN